MLTELSVRNVALLEDMRLELGPGFTVVTGETGAGKSLILDALGLAIGRRAEAGQIRQGAERLTVTARFQRLGPRPRALLAELGLEGHPDDELILRREIDPSGRSRAFANDHPVNLATLGRLGEILVYAHGQNEHQILLRTAEQRDLLDAFGGFEPLARDMADVFATWKSRVAAREALALSEQERAQRLDLYRFQKKELDAADVRPEEEADLETLLPQLRNADKLKFVARQAHDRLYAQEGAAADLLRQAQADLETLRGLGASVGETGDLLGAAAVQVEEAARRLESLGESIEADPARLEEVLARLDLLGKLKRKYGPSLADVAATRARVAAELDRLENLEGEGREVDRRVAEAEAALAAKAAALSEARRKAARKLSAAVQKEFRDVGLSQAVFDVEVLTEPGRFTSAGQDQVRFLFAANPGEGRRPLAEVASGGELSRVMLALESVHAQSDGVPVLIFDEIDAGVGGSLGAALGGKLARLARGRQVLCVTHLATIAACADAHWAVEKEVRKDRTRTQVRRLPEEERAAEIARLVGSAPGDQGLRHAQELLEVSRAVSSRKA